MSSLTERIVSLSFELSYDELEALLSVERAASPTQTTLVGLAEVLHGKVSTLEGRSSRYKYLLSGLNALAFNLMEWEYWADAELALSELVRLSVASDQVFFLYDARLRQAACLKFLRRTSEFESMKGQIPAGTRFWMQKKFWYVESL